eukprot:m.386265 g.386265  ORF g.386265 m.386265 type:complete len:193 (-) comp20053_c0_seq6:131-709(-)
MFSLAWLYGMRAQISWGLRFCCGVHVFNEYVGSMTQCFGPSMMPTINPRGDVIVTEALSPRLGLLQRGDVVVSRSPRDADMAVCKRVVALEGDRVCTNPTSWPPKYKTVPRNHVWLQGDNLSNSIDSRSYGAVPQPLIMGRAIAKVWPLNEACRLRREQRAEMEPTGFDHIHMSSRAEPQAQPPPPPPPDED